MIILGFFLAGFALGWRRARARGGQVADGVQFGLAHGIAGGLIGTIAVIAMMNFGIV